MGTDIDQTWHWSLQILYWFYFKNHLWTGSITGFLLGVLCFFNHRLFLIMHLRFWNQNIKTQRYNVPYESMRHVHSVCIDAYISFVLLYVCTSDVQTESGKNLMYPDGIYIRPIRIFHHPYTEVLNTLQSTTVQPYL